LSIGHHTFTRQPTNPRGEVSDFLSTFTEGVFEMIESTESQIDVLGNHLSIIFHDNEEFYTTWLSGGNVFFVDILGVAPEPDDVSPTFIPFLEVLTACL
jgi:hypothetical protein